jgi:lysophospholipid acyltransferase (LPLAT)-like uncharacterized protein
VLQQWVVRLAAAAAVGGLAWLSRGVELAGIDDARRELDSLGAHPGRRILFVHPIEDVIPRLVMDQVLERIYGLRLAPDALFVCSDTLLGAIAARVLWLVGRPSVRLSSLNPTLRIADLHRIVREVRPVCIVADGVAADGRAAGGAFHPRMWELVKRRGALAVPVSISCSRAVRVRRFARLMVPYPGSRIALAIGPIVDPRAVSGDGAERSLEESLHAASERAAALLRFGR